MQAYAHKPFTLQSRAAASRASAPLSRGLSRSAVPVAQQRPQNYLPALRPLQAAPVGSQAHTVQRVGWLSGLAALAMANPITTTVGIGVATALAYWYWHKKPQAQKPAPPDPTTLAGIARALGTDPATLTQQLETGQGNLDINPLYRAFPGMALTGLVTPSLIDGLPEAPLAKVNEIFTRINALAFNYTGIYQSGNSAFLTHAGDCNTLAQMLVLAAQAAGVEGVEIEDDNTPMLVVPHAIHGRNTVGNTEGAGGWFFYDHHWCTFQGTRYDLLFMSHATPPASHLAQQNQVHNGVQYDVFDNGRAIIHASQFGQLNVALNPGSVGYVTVSAQAAREYIDLHKRV